MKLTQHRSLSYPLKITVDGQPAYTGVTPASLGYVTLPLKPTKGKTVRIQTTGSPRPSKEFDLTEVTGKQSNDGDALPANTKGTLGLVEAELFGLRNKP